MSCSNIDESTTTTINSSIIDNSNNYSSKSAISSLNISNTTNTNELLNNQPSSLSNTSTSSIGSTNLPSYTNSNNMTTTTNTNTSSSTSTSPKPTNTNSSSSSSSSSATSASASSLNAPATTIITTNGNGINGTMAQNGALTLINGNSATATISLPMPSKIVSAGSQMIITTQQAGTSQKVISVAPSSLSTLTLSSQPGGVNNGSQSAVSVLNAATSSIVAAASAASNGSANSLLANALNQSGASSQENGASGAQQAQSNSSSANNGQAGTTTLYSLQPTSGNQSYQTFTIEANDSHNNGVSQPGSSQQSNGNATGVSVYSSPIGNVNNYYQTTGNYGGQPQAQNRANQITITTDHHNNHIHHQGQPQQPQQQQAPTQQPQQVYYMFQDTSMDQMDTSMQLDSFDGHVSHTAQAAPITVQWLIDNFEPAEGCSLRRSTLYNYYLHHCTEQKLEPVNPASFGKLIRSVFLGLRTRRLGTRGNSKYHYYGIRVKGNSMLNQLTEDHTFAIRNHPMSLSPTGSPSSPTNSTGHGTPMKRKAAPINNYEPVEYKPVIVTSGNGDQQIHIPHQQPPPVMTVIVAPNGTAVGHKITPTATIAKTLNTSKPQQHANHVAQQQHQHLNGGTVVVSGVPGDKSDVSGLITQVSNVAGPKTVSADNSSIPSSLLIATTSAGEDEANRQSNEFISISSKLPNFGSIDLENIQLPSNCTVDDVKKFEELYKNNCVKILETVVALKLNAIEEIWLDFWRMRTPANSQLEEQLSTEKLLSLCEVKQVISYVKQSDFQFYQFCVEILIPDVLSNLPAQLVQSIRSLAKNLENWLNRALVKVPTEMKEAKLLVINTFSMTLRRYTSLNHLAQTVKNSLQNGNILEQMLHDINKVDFNYIREQATFICQCDGKLITKLEKEFKETLKSQGSTVDNWIQWLDNSVTYYLQQFEGTPAKYGEMARQFLLKWSFFCSSIIRDLTLRSAMSFGSFHLVRLLYDEYMYHLIEHKIANMNKKTPLEVMSGDEFSPLSASISTTTTAAAAAACQPAQ